MKAVILCGGKGLRMGGSCPCKPLANVGGMPILWHIMKLYSYYGIKEFILCLGHNGDAIKEFFVSMAWKKRDFQLVRGEMRFFNAPEDWTITFADTGEETMTGGRIKRIEKYIPDEEFMLTYGDGVADLDLHLLLSFHRQRGKIATVTGVRRPSGYGIMDEEAGIVTRFREKPLLDGWVNGGFFVLRRSVFAYIDGDGTIWEEGPLHRLVRDEELAVFPHQGFWQSVDTAKDLQVLNKLWVQEQRPWAKWEEEHGGFSQ